MLSNYPENITDNEIPELLFLRNSVMDSVTVIMDHWSRKQVHNPTGVSIRIGGAAWQAEWMYQHLRQLLKQGISQGELNFAFKGNFRTFFSLYLINIISRYMSIL